MAVRTSFKNLAVLLAGLSSVNAYWLMGASFITTERLDPLVNPGGVSSHVHSVIGGSNFGMVTNTSYLRESECTSMPIPEDHSNYWFPQLYFQHSDGSFDSVSGGAVVGTIIATVLRTEQLSDYLFNDKPGTTTAFPDDFRMLAGDPMLRSYEPTSAQRAVTFLCLNFKGTSETFNEFPDHPCPDGIRAQINFPSCWDGTNLDSPDHRSHVGYPSGGPDSGTCGGDHPVTLPRVFMEVYWGSQSFDSRRSEAMNPSQPFVLANGDPTGYSWHADFINGWEAGVLQRAVDGCTCNIYGDMQCCVDKGIFGKKETQCRITRTVDEQTTGRIPVLPGNNPVQGPGPRAVAYPDNTHPVILSPVYAYIQGQTPPGTGTPIHTVGGPAPTENPPATTPVETTPAETTPAEEPQEQVTTEPIPTEPVTTEPIPTEPVTTEPIPTEPVTTEPIPTEPVTVDPAPTEPVPTVTPPTPPGEEQPATTSVPINVPTQGPPDGNHDLPSGASPTNPAETSAPTPPSTSPSSPGNGTGNGNGNSGQCHARPQKRSNHSKSSGKNKRRRNAHKRMKQAHGTL